VKRVLALLVLLSIAAGCGRRAAIYAGSDVLIAGSAAMSFDGAAGEAEPEQPVNVPEAGRLADSGSTQPIDAPMDASSARDAATPEPDGALPVTPDASLPIDAGAPCATGRVCAADSDCASNNCDNGVAVTGVCL